MTDAELRINGQVAPVVACELEIVHDQIDASVAVDIRPNRRWEHTDAAGHWHAWSDDDTLPTLRKQYRQMPCSGHVLGFDDPDECEGYEKTYYTCVICEVACVAAVGNRAHAPCCHNRPTWADTQWLRLLWHAQQAPEGSPLNADAARVSRCWTPQRVHRLRKVLGVTGEAE